MAIGLTLIIIGLVFIGLGIVGIIVNKKRAHLFSSYKIGRIHHALKVTMLLISGIIIFIIGIIVLVFEVF